MRARWTKFRGTVGGAQTARWGFFTVGSVLIAGLLCYVTSLPVPLLGLVGAGPGAWIGRSWAQDPERYANPIQYGFQGMLALMMAVGVFRDAVWDAGWMLGVGTLLVGAMSAWSALYVAFFSDENVLVVPIED